MARIFPLKKVIQVFLGLGLIVSVAACGTTAATARNTSEPPPNLPASVQTVPQGNAGAPSYAPGAGAYASGIAAPAGASAVAPAQIYPPPQYNATNTGIWVTGQGKISARPTLAVLALGIEAFRDTVQQARDDAAASMDRIIKALKAQGIAEKDIQTQHFNIFPRYGSRPVNKCPEVPRPLPGAGAEPGRAPSGPCYQYHEQFIQGYQITSQVTVEVRDLESVGTVIDKVAEAGGNLTRVNGLSFTVEDPKALRSQARAEAVQDAVEKARQMASLTGARVGKLMYMTEGGGSFDKGYPVARAALEAGGPATTILAGELDIVVTVQAAFAIE